MRILVDIGHPAHVHLYKNFINEMSSKGHLVLVSVKQIPAAISLLESLSIPYLSLGAKSDNIISKALNQIVYDYKILKIIRNNNIDFGVGTSVSLNHASKLSKIKSFFLEDDDSSVIPFSKYFAHPFADFVVSPDVLDFERQGKNHITYSGYHELAYLHPNRFQPDPKVLTEIGMSPGDIFFVLRFNAFKAHHDVGIEGLSKETKYALIRFLSTKGKIYITTEGDIDPEFKEYQLKISPDKIHSLLYFATMFIGDSQTMTSEAAVLGTPAIRSNSLVGKISYLNEEESKYGLTYGFRPNETNHMLSKIAELLGMSDLTHEWQRRRERMLADKIDVTAFLVWLIESYPESCRTIKNSPDYQLRFR